MGGGMVIDPAGKRQMTNLTMNVSGSGIYKVVDTEDGTDYTPVTQGTKTTFQVPKNAKLGITFTPKDFSKPYYEAYTKEKGSSFSLLAELKDTTGGTSYDLAKKADGSFADGVSFDWVTKSYTVAYTATEAQNTLEAVFAKSHVFRVFLSGGTAQITALNATGSALLHRDHDDSEADAHHVIVRDGTSLKVVMKRNADNTDKNTFTAYWAVVDNGTQTRGEDLPDKDTKLVVTGNETYTYETPAVNDAYILNATFEKGQKLRIRVKNGAMVNLPADYQKKPEDADRVEPAWLLGTDGMTYTAGIDYGKTVIAAVKPTQGYIIKSVSADGTSLDAAAAIAAGVVEYDKAHDLYIYRSSEIYRSWDAAIEFAKENSVRFTDSDGGDIVSGSATVLDGDTIPGNIFDKMVEWAKDAAQKVQKTFFAWVDEANRVYTKLTGILKDVILKPLFRTDKVVTGADGSAIAADQFVIARTVLQSATDATIRDLAQVSAYEADGTWIEQSKIQVEGLAALQAQAAGSYTDAISFSVGSGENRVTVKVDVEITEQAAKNTLAIIGRTAHTLTIQGKPAETYTVQLTENGQDVGTVGTDENGVGTVEHLERDTEYTIFHALYGTVTGKTALVDAKTIAERFAQGDEETTHTGTGINETADNSKAAVTVAADGLQYVVAVKADIDRTIQIPDTWGTVTLDLNGHEIKGADAGDAGKAGVGLLFLADETANAHPGTTLKVVNGTIRGGNGSAAYPNGAPGVSTAQAAARHAAPTNAKIDVGTDAKILGGKGADAALDSHKNGGNGGAGIAGSIETVVNGGSVTGGDGGNGADANVGKPGDGGNGGSGTSTNRNVTLNSGSITGGNGGKGGKALGNNTETGGTGGAGGSGNGGSGTNNNTGGTINGGAGGAGGDSDKGNGGTGGTGGDAGNNNNTGNGTENGGAGGNGGSSENGTGGAITRLSGSHICTISAITTDDTAAVYDCLDASCDAGTAISTVFAAFFLGMCTISATDLCACSYIDLCFTRCCRGISSDTCRSVHVASRSVSTPDRTIYDLECGSRMIGALVCTKYQSGLLCRSTDCFPIQIQLHSSPCIRDLYGTRNVCL